MLNLIIKYLNKKGLVVVNEERLDDLIYGFHQNVVLKREIAKLNTELANKMTVAELKGRLKEMGVKSVPNKKDNLVILYLEKTN